MKVEFTFNPFLIQEFSSNLSLLFPDLVFSFFSIRDWNENPLQKTKYKKEFITI